MKSFKNVLISLIVCLNSTSLSAEEHPFTPLIGIAKDSLEHINKGVQDYTTVLVKNDATYGSQRLYVKVRHDPFSVYVKFLSPTREAGKEAIYKDGQITAHGVGAQRVFGTLILKPTSPLAMAGQRYPVTELGIKRLAERVVEVGSKEKNYGECTASVEEDSGTTCYTIEHPYPRKQFFFHVAKIFVRDKLPVRIQLFDWDKTLVEDYEYTNIKLNQGLTDRDFDSEEYGF